MDENVVARLKRRVNDARTLGFKVRMEPLDGEQATWCEIGGVRTLFIDLSQTAGEQLQQLDEALATYCRCLTDNQAIDSTQGSVTSGRRSDADYPMFRSSGVKPAA